MAKIRNSASPITESPPCLLAGIWSLRSKNLPVNRQHRNATQHTSSNYVKYISWTGCREFEPADYRKHAFADGKKLRTEQSNFPAVVKISMKSNLFKIKSYVKRAGPIETLREWNRKSNTMTGNLQVHGPGPVKKLAPSGIVYLTGSSCVVLLTKTSG